MLMFFNITRENPMLLFFLDVGYVWDAVSEFIGRNMSMQKVRSQMKKMGSSCQTNDIKDWGQIGMEMKWMIIINLQLLCHFHHACFA